MPNCTCAASFCKNTRLSVRKQKLEIIFHIFPSDETLRRTWVKFCKRDEDWTPSKLDTLCSVHFKKSDYQMANSPLMNLNKNLRRLCLDAYPSVLKAAPMAASKRKKLHKQTCEKLIKQLYYNDPPAKTSSGVDHNYSGANAYDEWEDIPTAYDKIVYRLHKFPNVCAFCFKTIEDENLFTPFASFHDELGSTVEKKFDEVTFGAMDSKDRDDVRHLLPDKVCNECLETLVKLHQFQKQLECMRRFSTGMAHMFKGNREILEDLYQEEGAHLIKMLKRLNLCHGSDDMITVDRLALEVPTYGRVRKYTKFGHDPPNVNVPKRTFLPEHDAIGTNQAAGNELIRPFGYSGRKHQANIAAGSTKPEAQTGGAKWSCPYKEICNECFPDESSLQQHTRVDHTMFKCSTCGTSMPYYDLFKKHIESHAVARALLLTHSRIKLKPHQCDRCDKSFNSEELFHRHRKTHEGMRNYVCGTCLGVFLGEQVFGSHVCSLPHKKTTFRRADSQRGDCSANKDKLEASPFRNGSDPYIGTDGKSSSCIESLQIEVLKGPDDTDQFETLGDIIE